MFWTQNTCFCDQKSLMAGETRPPPFMANVMNYFHFFWEHFPIQTLLQMLMWWSEVEAEVEVDGDCNGGGRGNLS